jgi:hypothetical protein
VLLAAEDLVNWRTEHRGSDPSKLVQVVLREEGTERTPDGFGHRPTVRYRELALNNDVYQVRLWTASDSALVRSVTATPFMAGEWVTPTRRGRPMDFIPVVIASPQGLSVDVAEPPMEDLALLALAHRANSADLEHGLHFTALPTPWVAGLADPSAKVRIGSSVCWVLEKDGKAGMLEFGGQGLAAIRDAMVAKERAMSIAGSRLLLEPASSANAETATSSKLRYASEVASLRSIADACAQVLTATLRTHVWWETGLSDDALPRDVSVQVSRDFFSPAASAEEVKTLLVMLQSDAISYATFYERLRQGGWTRQSVTAEEEREEISRQMPLAPMVAPLV